MVSVESLKQCIVIGLPVNDLERPRARCDLREVPRLSIKARGAEHRTPPARHAVDQHGDRPLEI